MMDHLLKSKTIMFPHDNRILAIHITSGSGNVWFWIRYDDCNFISKKKRQKQ